MGYKDNVCDFVEKYAKKNMDGTVAGSGSQAIDQQIMMKSFKRWHALGYKIQSPENITQKHMEVLVRDWFNDGHAVKTMDNDLSRMRTLLSKSGKPRSFVKTLKEYLPDVDPKKLMVSTIAKKSKSPAEKGINVFDLLRQADERDKRFGLMLRLQLSFGLRAKEVLHTNPSAASIDDNAYRLYEKETKGNRPRFIRVMTPDQDKVLRYVTSELKKGEFLRWPKTPHGKESTYKWARRRYYWFAESIGLTLSRSGAVPHGLRAQFAENSGLITGYIPKTLGGKSGQMPRDDRELIEGGIKEDLGHSFHRRDIMGAYCGSFGRLVEPCDSDYIKLAIEEGLAELSKTGEIEEPDPEKLEDSLKMIRLLAKEGVSINVAQVQTLWSRHSRYRIGCEWSDPQDGVVERALAVEGTRHLRSQENNNENGGEHEAK